METQTVTAAAAAAAPIQNADSGADQNATLAAGALSSDFTTFLQLLTAQLKNQDPLNPMDGTEFVAQLAQFSAVEQQVRGNDTLERIESALIGGEGLAEWLGLEVETTAALSFQGEALDLRYEPDPDAAQATLLIQNEAGLTLAVQPLRTGIGDIEWDGRLGTGTAPLGSYRFEVEEVSTDGARTLSEVSGYATVREARAGAGGVDLVLDSGGVIPSSEVKAARSPGA